MYGSKPRGSSKNKNAWVLVLVLLAGEVVGGFIGQLVGMLANAVPAVSFLHVLDYGQKFGLAPVTLDLGVIQLTLGMMFNFTVWGILGLAVAGFVYYKM